MSTLRFITTDFTGSQGAKRTAPRACETCRRQKKRCRHSLGVASLERPSEQQEVQPSREWFSGSKVQRSKDQEVKIKDTIGDKRSTLSDTSPGPAIVSNSLLRSPRPGHPRFIGDLNPEVVLQPDPTATGDSSTSSVGIWDGDTAGSVSQNPPDSILSSNAGLFQHIPVAKRRLLENVIEDHCFKVLPTPADFTVLESVYFQRIHTILPLIDEKTYRNTRSGSPDKILQCQTISLLSSVQPGIQEHLSLPTKSTRLSAFEFGQTMMGSMRMLIELAIVSDKIVLIQALTAMSLFSWNEHSAESSSKFFASAVQMAVVIGCHLKREENPDSVRSNTVFCYLWSLDKLLAAMHGKPTIMHERDHERSISACTFSQPPGFRLFIEICSLLDKVIALYRPNATQDRLSDMEIPSYEKLVAGSSALDLPSSTISCLELYYHAVLILSQRYRRQGNELDKLPVAHQRDAATQIASIVSGIEPIDMILLPHVPYAISLSLSVAYREFRHSTLARRKTEAQKLLTEHCKTLKDLSKSYWSAGLIYEMARKLILQTPVSMLPSQHLDTQATQEQTVGETSYAPSKRRITGPGPVSHYDQNAASSLNEYQARFDLTDVLGPEWNFDDIDIFMEETFDPSVPSLLY